MKLTTEDTEDTESTEETNHISLSIEMLQSITELLADADALLTDSNSLQRLRDEWGDDDSTYLWTKRTRALLEELPTLSGFI